ncbi:hypothetical protein [Streptomyces sp. NPDC051569]|uniref:hypothetical protein n=1 Tax=Streptomyces sp. NPDC051569 TaxID=3365661 RepID=UPI00378F2B3D
MKLALVSGDGLPVSGLLTIFRNVIEAELGSEELELPVVADLGYSWRPDKEHFFPQGRPDSGYPAWMSVSDAVPVDLERAELMRQLTRVRAGVARADALDEAERAELRDAIEALAGPYEEYFTRWLDDHDVDWVCAVNMTLSDAVPVTLGLHRAAAKRWADGRPGGVLFWDHDLFGSCAIFEDGVRLYPEEPNEFTPVPGSHPCHRWAVVSPALAKEVSGYPTSLTASILPNVLPVVESGRLQDRHTEFLAQRDLDRDRPLLLVPVRMFRVKGVEISVSLLAEAKKICESRGTPAPYLVVFGSLDEDPPYAREVLALAGEIGVLKDIAFLDGVPLASHLDAAGQWRLDEVDLLRLCRSGPGAVLFTPNTADVESVGLGPALAAIAGVPCAVTDFTCFEDFYGSDSGCVVVKGYQGNEGIPEAARALVDLMDRNAAADPPVREGLDRDREYVLRSFDPEPWRAQFRSMTLDATPR